LTQRKSSVEGVGPTSILYKAVFSPLPLEFNNQDGSGGRHDYKHNQCQQFSRLPYILISI